MPDQSAATLRDLSEPLVVLSDLHLTPATRQKLAADDLSVNAYPSKYGGLVYVGAPPYDIPTEGDLATVFVAAERAGALWLMFDCDAPVVDGLPAYQEALPATCLGGKVSN
jgi:hypothetical protein